MSANDETNGNSFDQRVRAAITKVEVGEEVSPSVNHVVFDFSGLRRPNVADLALILTARLQTPPDELVWIRAIDPHTARVLGGLGLDHLFRHYPGTPEIH
ncbi:MAG: hypothetical protein O2992_02150 [Gemmatimonadetes bacterium]|jgi:hypothetical protein|nr:hypothetical protein [Gemmatimonadota bacterium]